MKKAYVAVGTLTLFVALLTWYFWNYLTYLLDSATDDSDPPIDGQMKTTLDSDGTVCVDGVPADPNMLAQSAGLDLETYAIARLIQSEVGTLPLVAKQGVAAAARNYASSRGGSVASILLKATKTGNGYFGKQNQGRYAATSRDPGASAIAAASGAGDPTGGADQWDSPWSYPTTARADEVAAARVAAGKVKVVLDGVPEKKLRFWRLANG